MEGPGMNPLFADVPHIKFMLSTNPKKMIRSYQKVLCQIKHLITSESARENNGVSQYAGHATPIEVPPYHVHRVSMLPMAVTKYFILVMHFPKELEDSEKRQPLKFLFWLRNLYLDGFLYKNMWRLFKGTKLVGVDKVLYSQHVKELNFTCNYNDLKPDYFTLRTGLYGQLHTFNTLTSELLNDEQMKIALSRLIATVPEAIRFPSLSRRIMCGFNRKNENELMNRTIDNENDPEFFRDIVTSWSTYCQLILAGKENFIPPEGFPTYESLVAYVGVAMYIRDSVRKVGAQARRL